MWPFFGWSSDQKHKAVPSRGGSQTFCSEEFSSQGYPRGQVGLPSSDQSSLLCSGHNLRFPSLFFLFSFPFLLFSPLLFLPLSPPSLLLGMDDVLVPLLKHPEINTRVMGLLLPIVQASASLKQMGKLPTQRDREGTIVEHSAIYKISMANDPGHSLSFPHQRLISRELTLENTAPTGLWEDPGLAPGTLK